MVVATAGLEQVLARMEDGREVRPQDAAHALAGAALDELLQAATGVRAGLKGRTVSYSKKVFIPLTTLCRDYCGYCTFRRDPGEPGAGFMTPEEVLSVAEAGRAAGCKEALFSLGDQPERAFPAAREFLRHRGYSTTLEYLADVSRLVLKETGLLPHANPGLLERDDLLVLRETNVSMGLMLENVSPRLLRRGGAHWRAPDKAAALRLATLEQAGRLKIPFTTGILIGIGETIEERVESLHAIRRLHEQYGHIQEVIVQNFRAKPSTRMAFAAEPSMEDMLRTVAGARLILGRGINLQAPPNLSYESFPRLLEAGINDWGGVSPVTRDFINPEAPWPHLAVLGQKTAEAGFRLRERLAIYPEFIRKPGFVTAGLQEHLQAMAGPDGYALEEGVMHDEGSYSAN